MTDIVDPVRDARKNRERWDAEADGYQRDHGSHLKGEQALAWGIWRIPESELQVLGDVRGKDVLELGCGAAQWSIVLGGVGANVFGLDNSGSQLKHALEAIREAGVSFPIVQASADKVPFRDEVFDIVFCDYGGMHFADPYLTVPEAARLLRPGGLLAFSTVSPICDLCWPNDTDDVSRTLHQDYFGMRRFEIPGEPIAFNLNYGDWISVFRGNGFIIEDLLEPRPPEDATTSFEGRPLEWARRWPAEAIWRVRKSSESGSGRRLSEE